MKPVNFDYARPDAVDAVIRLIADDSRTVKMMAGSQSLGPMLNLRLVQLARSDRRPHWNRRAPLFQ
ncbi:CO/xanthine dehydrogenase FAD-binding subunit [Bradyrhizobium sp. JR3.5]